MAGASAGALLAAGLKGGMNVDEMTEWCLRLMDDCRRHGTTGRIGVRQRGHWMVGPVQEGRIRAGDGDGLVQWSGVRASVGLPSRG